MTPDFAARAANGAALLDRRAPGWHRKVAVDRLAIESCDRCVLGQVFGHFVSGKVILIRAEPSLDRHFFGRDHGFVAQSAEFGPEGSGHLRYLRALADCWRAEVAARLIRDAIASPTAEVAP